ncbi:GerMN domain-containing protein [Alkaliphilus crotonatoxidans]
MKKLLLVLSTILLLTACTKEPAPNNPVEEPTEYTVEDYFPFIENTRLVYEGEGNEYAAKEVYFDFIEGSRAQLRISNPGTTVAQVYEVRNGEVRLLSSQEEMYIFHNMIEDLSANTSSAEVVLKEPLVKGTSWTLTDGRVREITGEQVPVKTPHGDYEALEVTTIVDEEVKTVDYYAVDRGLIKTVYTSGDIEIVTALAQLEENAAVNKQIRFYYPDFHNETIVYVEEMVEFQTNDDIKRIFQERLKEGPGEEIRHVIDKNVEIKEVLYQPKEESVLVDFNSNLITEMNAGAFLEGQILKSLANSFGDYFNVPKVFLRIEGETYGSGHFFLEEDEYLTPALEEAQPYHQ